MRLAIRPELSGSAAHWKPEADYELRPDGSGGCEDPRITFIEPLQRYVMTYTAYSSRGPRIALAISDDLFHWERMGLAIILYSLVSARLRESVVTAPIVFVSFGHTRIVLPLRAREVGAETWRHEVSLLMYLAISQTPPLRKFQ